MGLLRRERRQVEPATYRAVGGAYLAYLQGCFEWNLENRGCGDFAPVHLAACHGGAHAAAAILHGRPRSPWFRDPAPLDDALKGLLLRTQHVMAHALAGPGEAGEVLEEAGALFSRDEAEHRACLSVAGRLHRPDVVVAYLAEPIGAPGTDADQVVVGLAHGRAIGDGLLGAIGSV